MRALTQDREKRRYRHHWEHAIAGLVRAAKGKDRAPAFLEAARARYALYRWSADEADREKALLNAGRAAKLGSREAGVLAAAIRREAGDDRPAPKPSRGRGGATSPAPEETPQDSEPDPELDAALADLTGAGSAPALALGESGGEGRARVTDVRTWSTDDYTRVAIYLSHWVGWQKLELAPAVGLPRRLAVDLRPASLAGRALARPVAGERVDRVRAAQNDADTVRVVLDLPGTDRVQLFGLDDPPRLIVDVGTVSARRSVAEAPPPAEPARPAPEPPSAATGRTAAVPASFKRVERAPEHDLPTRIRRIVVDAGHGGHDPGAIGPRRVREKQVTLAIAKRLATRLRAAGFEVALTRKDDRYLALEERTAIANTAGGDLFVSIHANAHPRRNRSGVETYFLNVADDRYAARLAARENGIDPSDRGAGDAGRILTDLDAKASAGASERLAGLVQRELTTGVRARVGEVRDLGVKSALFYVLLGARMPAVLVETAFISNRVEEQRLASDRYQDEVAAGITRAVTAFARSEARVAAVR
ncbi:N-acetylmuramoyl-L-alanine amidase [Anaeromyxobacter terrae]|uniref:N-acetylmuramoyl-L-alanine amidase n=1 Tax=Anaeromyxobacter terrae TaxID=2925406 RepID=UPI001F59D5BE|nr:N-acetylmuramoyl-L-alanine amidase [Anaeromyxobacter sp. SG22]